MAKSKSLEKFINMKSLLLANIDKEFVVLDIETSGLSPDKGGRIIEIGAVKIKAGKIVDKFSQLINPEQKLYQKTIELTGITNEMVIDKPVYGQVLPKFFEFIGESIIVAHNAMFDWDRYLTYFFKKVGRVANNKVIDTLVLSKGHFTERKTFKLIEVCNEFGIEINNHHRALDDAMATGLLLLEFMKAFDSDKATTFLQTEQIDLFTSQKENKEVQVKPRTEYKIKRIKYWEKAITKRASYKRIYVTLSIGSTYFDISTKTWYNKDVKEPLDFEVLQKAVFQFLRIKTIEQFCDFRN